MGFQTSVESLITYQGEMKCKTSNLVKKSKILPTLIHEMLKHLCIPKNIEYNGIKSGTTNSLPFPI